MVVSEISAIQLHLTIAAVATTLEVTANTELASLLKSLQGGPTNVNADIKCDLCKDEEATMYCAEGTQTLHQMFRWPQATKIAANHRQISLEDALGGSVTVKRIPRCPVHIGMEINAYCKTCNISVCSHALETHTNDEVIPLSQMNAALQDQIVTFAIKMGKKEETAKKAITTMDGTLSQLEKNRTTAEKEIDQICDSLVASVEQRRHDLKQRIDELRKAVVKERNEAESATLEFREFKLFAERILAKGTPHEIAGSHKMVIMMRSMGKISCFDFSHFLLFLSRQDPSQK